MATIGLVQPWLMGLVPGRLILTTSDLLPRLSTRHTAQVLVGSVTPSAVWYTSYSAPLVLFCKRLKETRSEQYHPTAHLS